MSKEKPIIYGAWAGNPKGHVQVMDRCAESVWCPTTRLHSQCARKGVNSEDGEVWCKQHTPSLVKAKQVAKQAEYDARYKASSEAHERRQRAVQYHDELVALLEEMVNTVEWEEGTERVMSTNNAKLYKLMGGTARALLAKVKA